MSLALVLIDLQNDFLSPNGAYARGDCVNPQAQALPAHVLPLAQAVRAAGGMVVASQFTLWPNTKGEPMISPHLKQMRPFLRAGDFAPGSWGQASVDSLQPVLDLTVQKVAYSAFFNTQLDWVLRRAGVQQVWVGGIVTNGGVASTVRDAHMRDYHTTVLADGCAAFGDAVHQAALADMGTVARVCTVQEAMQQLQPRQAA
jgi:ureidoacrylate peracid hydrolase